MLSLGPGSACDVCLEPFGRGGRAPFSVSCGHVFCIECITRVVASNANPGRPAIDMGAPCPLCRKHFDQRTVVKLHIDFDNVRGLQGGSPVRASCPTAAESEARRLQEAIANVANTGTTEAELRKLIGEATIFLSTQPRDQFADLRVSHRMIAYLCDIKSKLRDQKAGHEKVVQQLVEEKAELNRQAEVVASARKDEKETALAVEMSLRHHCARAHKAYEDMVGHVGEHLHLTSFCAKFGQQYNFVVSEWTKISEQLARLRDKEVRLLQDPQAQPISVTITPDVPSNVATPFSSYHNHQVMLSGAAVSDPSSFLVSPLPEFTSAGLPLTSMNAFPLPDFEDDWEPEDKPKARLNGQSSPSCIAPGHPVSCPCSEVPRFPDMPHFVQSTSQAGPSSSRGRSASFIERPAATAPLAETAPIAVMPEPQSNELPNGPDHIHRARRSSSRGSRHSSRPSSRAPTRSSSPLHRPTSAKSQSRVATPLEESIPSSSKVTAHQSWNNNRLQDLLQDTPLGTSSSLPNMPSHFPSSIRESHHSRKDRSRSPSRQKRQALHPPQLSRDREPSPAADTTSFEPAPVRINPPASYDPNAPVSTASSAAIAIEKAKRERQRAEREAEKDRERRKADKRDRAEQDDRRSLTTSTSERPRIQTSVSGPSSQSAPSTQREPTSIYVGATSTYAPQRMPSHSNRSVPSALRDSFSADKHISKTVPVMNMARV